MVTAGVKDEERAARQKLMLGAVIFSRGIPFIHAGQEMCLSKGGDHNSYKSSDNVNGIDWNRRSEYKDVIKFVKDAIDLRKNTEVFREMEYDDKTIAIVNKHKKPVETRLIVSLPMVQAR